MHVGQSHDGARLLSLFGQHQVVGRTQAVQERIGLEARALLLGLGQRGDHDRWPQPAFAPPIHVQSRLTRKDSEHGRIAQQPLILFEHRYPGLSGRCQQLLGVTAGAQQLGVVDVVVPPKLARQLGQLGRGGLGRLQRAAQVANLSGDGTGPGPLQVLHHRGRSPERGFGGALRRGQRRLERVAGLHLSPFPAALADAACLTVGDAQPQLQPLVEPQDSHT